MIYVPSQSVAMLEMVLNGEAGHSNRSICTKIEFRGYEISISSDSSHGPGNLFRTDIRVYKDEVDVTASFSKHLLTDGEDLYSIMREIADTTDTTA